MGKIRGFRLQLVKVLHCSIRHRTRTRRTASAYLRQKPSAGPISKLCKWVHSLRWGKSTSSGYIQVGQEPVELPKGHLAVYVGNRDDDTCRVLVPVIHINHPLFGELLREAEEVHGFNHPGGIQIPCPKSKLESVQMRISAASRGGIWRRRRR